MALRHENEDADVPVVVGRRSARLSVIVPITVRGTDQEGQAFKENTWTIGVNKHGGKLALFHQVQPKDLIVIENPVLGRSAKARVIRVGDKRFPEDPYELSVELLEAQNVWGVKFPPEDWQKGRPPTAGGRAPEKAVEPSPPPPSPTTPASAIAPPQANGKTPSEAGAKSDKSNGHGEEFNQFNLAMTAISQFAKEAGHTAPSPSSAAAAAEGTPAGAIEAKALAAFQEAFRQLDERLKAVDAAGKQVESLLGNLQSSRTEFAGMLLKAIETQQTFRSDFERAQQKLEQTNQQAFQSALEKLNQKAQERLAALTSSLAEEVRPRIELAATASVSSLLQRSAGALAEDIRKQILEEVKSVAEAARQQAADKSTEELQLLIQPQVAAALEVLSQDASNRLSGLLNESLSKVSLDAQARQSQASSQAQGELDRLAEATAASFKERIQAWLEEISPRLRGDFQKAFEDSARESGERLVRSLQEEFQETARTEEESLRERIGHLRQEIKQEMESAGDQARQLSKQAVESAGEAIGQALNPAMDRLNRSAAESAAHLQKLSRNLEAEVAEVAEDFRQRLVGVAATAFEEFRDHAESQSKVFQNDAAKALGQLRDKTSGEISEQARKLVTVMQEALKIDLEKQTEDALELFAQNLESARATQDEEARQRIGAMTEAAMASMTEAARAAGEEFNRAQAALRQSLSGLEAEFRSIRERQREGFSTQLQKEAESAAERVAGLLRSAAESCVEAASDAMYKRVGVAAVVMRDWAEEAKAGLDAHFRKSADQHQKLMGDMTRGALEGHRTELTTLGNDFRKRLEQAARLFAGGPADNSKGAEPRREPIPAATPGTASASEEKAGFPAEPAKGLPTQPVEGIEQDFRKRLSEVFRDLQTQLRIPKPNRS